MILLLFVEKGYFLGGISEALVENDFQQMFESFIIMLREGIEAALVVGIILVTLKRTGRRDLERPVFIGLGAALVASIGAAIALKFLPVNDDLYEGILYWVSAIFVSSMMWWMHRNAKFLRSDIEQRIANAGEAFGLGAFAFLMVFREGAEAVLFLGAVSLTTDALLSFIGSVLGLTAAIVFCVMFVKGSLKVNLQRFFFVTEWILAIFVLQLFAGGYHELSESGLLPAGQASMALVGPIVKNNSLFIVALIALPLFTWLSKAHGKQVLSEDAAGAEKRLLIAQAKLENKYRMAAVTSALLVLLCISIAYTRQIMPKQVPVLESTSVSNNMVMISLQKLDDGKLHRFGFLTKGKMVRFLAMKTSDGKYRAGLDACVICGSKGYTQKGENLVCLNCDSEINPLTLGMFGGCNPIPLEGMVVEGGYLQIPAKDLEKEAPRFHEEPGVEVTCAVCGMRMRVGDAGGFEAYHGKIYYFCKMGKCQALFKKNPAAYVK